MKIKLLKLALKNFKGCRSLVFEPNGLNCSVYGDNGTYKSTLYDSFTWVLFDKNSQGQKDFDIKTLDETGKAISGLEHEVECVLNVNGQTLTLRKVYYENWVKKRGSIDPVFTGHSCDHFVNGVPVQKKDYDARIAEIANEDIFKLLTNPMFFNDDKQFTWQKRRALLMEIGGGEISEGDVITANPQLAELPKILNGRKPDDYKKIIVARKAEVNKEIEKIPVRIDEVENSLPVIPNDTPANIQASIAKLQSDLTAKQAELATIESGGGIAEKTKKLREVEAELLKIQNEFRQGIEIQIESKQRQIETLRTKAIELTEKTICPRPVTDELESDIERLHKKWHEVNAREFTAADTCPTCGQAVPTELIEEARASFNRQKAEELERISAEGKEKKSMLDRLNAEYEERLAKAGTARAELANVEARIASIQSEIEALRKTTAENIPSYIAKAREKATIEAEIAKLQSGSSEAAERVQNEIRTINSAIQSLQMAQANLEQRERGLRRIAELKQQERDLAKEYERLEKESYLLEEFTRTKVGLITDKINSKFKMARFKLFEQQINGGIAECCETLYNGVPFSSGLNHAAQINVGIDIINTLSEHYGISVPIFIDNAEAVTQLSETKGQVIRLVVSERDKKLRVEMVAQKQTQEAV